MSILTWSEKYQTGILRFDQEHQQLVQRFNDLYTDVFECETIEQERTLTEGVLKDLLTYVATHFAGEEAMMEKYLYPEYEEHKKAHQRFSEEVHRLMMHHVGGEVALSFPIFEFVKKWIDEHILLVDKRYGMFFKDKLD